MQILGGPIFGESPLSSSVSILGAALTFSRLRARCCGGTEDIHQAHYD